MTNLKISINGMLGLVSTDLKSVALRILPCSYSSLRFFSLINTYIPAFLSAHCDLSPGSSLACWVKMLTILTNLSFPSFIHRLHTTCNLSLGGLQVCDSTFKYTVFPFCPVPPIKELVFLMNIYLDDCLFCKFVNLKQVSELECCIKFIAKKPLNEWMSK